MTAFELPHECQTTQVTWTNDNYDTAALLRMAAEYLEQRKLSECVTGMSMGNSEFGSHLVLYVDTVLAEIHE